MKVKHILEARYANDYTKWVMTNVNNLSRDVGKYPNHNVALLDLPSQQEANVAIDQLESKFGEPIRNPNPEWRIDGKIDDTVWSFKHGGITFIIHVHTSDEFKITIDQY